MFDELGNVLAPIAERRNRDRKDVEAIVQVATEAALTDFLGQVTVGRGDDPHVDVDRARAAQPLDLAFLEHSEQLGLELERQLPDLVEQNRPAVGQLEASDLRRVRAGERAALASEELALHEVGRQRRAVDDDERTGAPRAAPVDGAGEQFLAGAGLSRQEHRGIGRRHLVDAEHHIPKRVAVADDRVAIDRRQARDRHRKRHRAGTRPRRRARGLEKWLETS